MSKSIYLGIDWKSGQLCEKSKEEKEGFEAYSISDGSTRYKKLYDKGITGKLHSVEMKESPIGLQIVSTFVDEDTWYNVQISVLDQRDQVADYAIELARFLPNLVKGEVYRFYPYYIEKDGKEQQYDRRGLSFKVGNADGNKVAPALSWAKDANEAIRIPQLEWETNPLTKKKKPTASSIEARTNFFAVIFEREVARFKDEEEATPTDTTPPPFGPPADVSPDKTSSAAPTEEESDDLPF